MIILRALRENCKRKLIFSFAVGFVYAAFAVVGAELANEGRLPSGLGGLSGLVLLVIAATVPLGAAVYCILTALPVTAKFFSAARTVNSPSLRPPRRNLVFFVSFAVIFFSWFICFLAFYPGIFAYDAPTHVHELYCQTMSTHHPLIHTLKLGVLLWFGGNVLNSWQAGLAIYTLINMAALAASAAYSLAVLRKINANVCFIAAGALFLAASPVIAVLAVSTTKDIMFSALCVFLFLFMYDAFLEPERFFGSKRLQARFVITVVLMALFKNNGIYAFFVCMPFVIIPLKNYRLRMSALCFGGAVLYMLTAAGLQTASQAESGSIAEALSIPIQQVARVYVERNAELDEETRARLTELMYSIRGYNPRVADWVKISFNDDVFRADRGYFARLWLELGLRYPREYVTAFLMNTHMLWYVNFNDRLSLEWLETDTKHGGREELFPAPVLPALQSFYQNSHNREFLLQHRWFTLLHSPATLTWLFIFAVAASWYFKNYKLLFPLMFLAGLWLSAVFSPIILPRYMLMFYILMPFMLYPHINGFSRISIE